MQFKDYMRTELIDKIKQELNLTEKQIINVMDLLEAGNTVPFIARYRKEKTGNLDEEKIRELEKVYSYQEKLLSRKEEVKRLIDEKGLLTKEIEDEIEKATILQEVEDIYLPFKEKKKTKATEAIKNGLEPLSKYILKNNSFEKIKKESEKYINENVTTIDAALEQAGYIIAENLSENAKIRDYVRRQVNVFGLIQTKAKKNILEIDPDKKFEIYYDFQTQVKKIKPYQVLAINRAEKNKIINVKFIVDEERIINFMIKSLFRYSLDFEKLEYILNICKDSLKRLLLPSICRETRNYLTEIAEDRAINVFATNLEELLLTPPLKDKIVLGVDPAYRTGCKLAIVDDTGKLLKIDKIFPTKPQEKINESDEVLEKLIAKYPINQIVIGNGTASRETEAYIKSFLQRFSHNIPVAIVSEAGASVYSASKNAQNEFPDLHVEERSAVSIARRVQDPMAELVKIEPKSIGVGLYQHDVNQKKLEENLDFVMIKNINKVGVNLNTASVELLKYISGLDKTIAKNIVEYRNEIGEFKNREQLKAVKRLGPKAFEQAAGFLKIYDGENDLDATFIHPESYNLVKTILETNNIELNNLFDQKEAIAKIDKELVAKDFNVSYEFIEDSFDAIINHFDDLRDEYEHVEFSAEKTSLEKLVVGEQIKGQIRNIADFGAFVDIGVKNDALIHISQISNSYVSNINDFINVGDILTFTIINIDLEKKRVELSLKN